MGALLDPVVDRLTILAGVVVCWHFELLPRWALAVLAARELVTLVLAQFALRRGVDLEINWVGRNVGLADHGRDLPGAGDRRAGSRPRCFLVGLAARCSPGALRAERPARRARRTGRCKPGGSSCMNLQPQLDLCATGL